MSGFNLADYEPVEDRIRSFWSDNPAGRITTELQPSLVGEWIVQASVWRDGKGEPLYLQGVRWPDATGLAHESVEQLPANMKASALEVCETSAIGRALANLGYAAKGKRPSREEMQKTSGAVREFGEGSQSAPESTSAPRVPASVHDAGNGGEGIDGARVPRSVGAGETSKAAEGRPLDEAGLSSGSDGGPELPAPTTSNHVHDWKENPPAGIKLRAGWVICECGSAKPKRAAS